MNDGPEIRQEIKRYGMEVEFDTVNNVSDNKTKYPNPCNWLKSLTDSTRNQGIIPPPENSATAVTVPNKFTYKKFGY